MPVRFRRYFAAAFMFVMLLAARLHAQTVPVTPIEKKRIAVLPFSAEMVDPSLSKIVRNAVEIKFYDTNSFLLIEIENIKKIAAENKMDITNLSKDANARNLGAVLHADFIICGSIQKVKNYTLILRAIRVDSGEVITACSADFEKEAQLYEVSDAASKRIAADIELYLKRGYVRDRYYDFANSYFSLLIKGSIPVGKFAALVRPGIGINAEYAVRGVFLNNFVAGAGLGAACFYGDSNSDDRLFLGDVYLHAGYCIGISRAFLIEPYLRCGAGLVVLRHASGDGFDMRENSTRYAGEPLVAGGLRVYFTLSGSLALNGSAGGGAIFESSGNVYYADLLFGVTKFL